MIQIPKDMVELRIRLEQLKELGDNSSEEDVIKDAVSDNAQGFLDEALEGHYYSCKLDGDTITVYGMIDEPVGTIKSTSGSFVDDFKNDAASLLLKLDTEVNKIVRNS
ncbi:hypothetical protein [Pediococcus argentinicus]|uniref:Uncharacterized protein n=1 Tax=Pediococcus argentinicus TaxID=480391 RepID=A0A0R2NI39_9LACO|nr:hypothetical protein [Pediococcus argentinicus]KRO25461.1 hypothetical protein IV88_GL001711 [Pediococcus argentinicus]NKZ22157.1 hypothetical protein [Pediococcus argentinicus]GEP19204.1 hypothetical protein LSA03_05880 [Pediococcus argentinicus]